MTAMGALDVVDALDVAYRTEKNDRGDPHRPIRHIRQLLSSGAGSEGHIKVPFGFVFESPFDTYDSWSSTVGSRRPLVFKLDSSKSMWFFNDEDFSMQTCWLPTAIRELHEVVYANEPCRFVLGWNMVAVAGDDVAKANYRRDLETLLEKTFRALGVNTAERFRGNDWKSVVYADASRRQGSRFKYSFRVIARDIVFDCARTMRLLIPVMRRVTRADDAMSDRLEYWDKIISGVDTRSWRGGDTHFRLVGSRKGDERQSYFLPYYPDVDAAEAQAWQIAVLQDSIEMEWIRASSVTQGIRTWLADSDDSRTASWTCFRQPSLRSAAIRLGCSDLELCEALLVGTRPGTGRANHVKSRKGSSSSAGETEYPGDGKLRHEPNAPPPAPGDVPGLYDDQWHARSPCGRYSAIADLLEACLRVHGDMTSIVSLSGTQESTDGVLSFQCDTRGAARTCPSGSRHDGRQPFYLALKPSLDVVYRCGEKGHALCEDTGLGIDFHHLREESGEYAQIENRKPRWYCFDERSGKYRAAPRQ